jgi:hypothetical protein
MPVLKRTERVENLKPFADGELLDGYLAEAAWFWFDASTAEMKLAAGLHRLVALLLGDELRRRGLELPEPAAVYDQARRTFPPDDLRPRRGRHSQYHFDNYS